MTDDMNEARKDLIGELALLCEKHDLSYNELLIVIAAASTRFAPKP